MYKSDEDVTEELHTIIKDFTPIKREAFHSGVLMMNLEKELKSIISRQRKEDLDAIRKMVDKMRKPPKEEAIEGVLYKVFKSDNTCWNLALDEVIDSLNKIKE